MPATIGSAALKGIDAHPVNVEVDVLPGLPGFTLVGLADKAIQESRERLTAALQNLNYKPPRRKTIISLAPASLKKEGSMYDLPIAVAYLIASRQITSKYPLKNCWFIGELGLDGTVRAVRGALPIILGAIKEGMEEIYIPASNSAEASPLADKIKIWPVSSLAQVVGHIAQDAISHNLKPLPVAAQADVYTAPEIDFSDIAGQEHAKRSLTICAAGGHNALLVGPPGTGKTLLAKAMVGILPSLTEEESYIVTSLYSIAGLLNSDSGLIHERPFRSPHHGASNVALIGGGQHPKPGEVSLAHHGVLFLDELPEFSRPVLEQLRQPIEDGYVTVARAAHSIKFPARSMILGAMNPCPCGFVGSTRKMCMCTPGDIVRYQKRISGPMLDRFDLHVLVADVPMEKLLSQKPSGQSSQTIRQAVSAARSAQYARQGKTNAELSVKEINKICILNGLTKKLMLQAQEKFHLSSRGVHRLLKVALTVADLEGRQRITTSHIAEALQYREQLKAVLPDFV